MNIKKLQLILIAACFSLFAVAHEGTKVGIVDADIVIQKSAKGKKFFESYQDFTKAKRDEIEKQVQLFRDREKDAQAKAASLSEDKRKEIGTELQKLQTEIKRLQEDAKSDADQMLNDGLDRFRKELAPLIRQIALEKGLDMVMNYGPQSSLVYISDSVNITQDVIKKYDEVSK